MSAKKSNGCVGYGCLVLLVIFVVLQVIGQAIIVPAVVDTNALVGKALADSVAKDPGAASASSEKIDQAVQAAIPFVRLVMAFIATVASIVFVGFGFVGLWIISFFSPAPLTPSKQ